jgi:hypothetical protein
MVVIRQHGSSGQLFDMHAFLRDVDKFFTVDEWRVKVDECVGDGALVIEQRTANEVTIDDSEFRQLYGAIRQTIDGEFVALSRGMEQCRLVAIDSSYWEVSGLEAFEDHMLRTYGAYDA